MKTYYEYTVAIQELLDDACNELSPKAFAKLLDDISMILCDYED